MSDIWIGIIKTTNESPSASMDGQILLAGRGRTSTSSPGYLSHEQGNESLSQHFK